MPRASSITGHLLLFALALALPILVMSGFIGWAYILQEEKRIDSLAERQANQVVAQIDNRLEAYRAALNVLAVGPTLLSSDVADIRSRLERVNLAPDIWFTLRDRSGQQVVNTHLPPGEALPAFSGRGDPVVFDEGKPFMSNLIWAPVTRKWAVTLSVPIRVPIEDAEVKYALSIGIPATHLQKFVTDVPEGWIATINDRNGKILARSLGHHQWVGRPMAQRGWEVTKDVPPGQGGLWRGVYTLEGRPVVGAYHRMASTGWLVGIAALPEVYEAPRRNILLYGSLLTAVSLLLAAVLAFLMGRRITNAIQVLQIKAAAMRKMRVIEFPRTSLDEINAVAEAMRDTARALQARQEQQTTLVQELNHRVKNTLATIQSISRMTIRNSKDMESFEESFSARLMALSKTHDLLTESGWSGVGLQDLLATELRPFQADARVSLAGPFVTLSSKIAVALGMAVHEMATNAAKYGALKGAEGRIEIRWSLVENTLRLSWQERSGRIIRPLGRQGFGSRLIQQTIVRELQGAVETDYMEDGLCALFTIPLATQDDLQASSLAEA